MEAVWSAIGVLAAGLFGTLFYLGARLDSGFDHVDTRLDSMSTRIDSLSERIDAMGARIDARLDAHIERHAG